MRLQFTEGEFDFLLGLSRQAFFAPQNALESLDRSEEMDGLRLAKEHCIYSFSGSRKALAVASRWPEPLNQPQPDDAPQVSHLQQAPLRTNVN